MARDLAIANAVGVAQTLVGFPLDIIKTRLQAQQRAHIKRACTAGLGWTLASNAVTCSLFFPYYDIVSKDVLRCATLGALSGVVVNIFEVGKVQSQTGTKSCAKTLLKTPHVWRAGMMWTVLREAIACPTYFQTYERLHMPAGAFVAGGIAGIASWTVTYPIDTLKTRAQASSDTTRKSPSDVPTKSPMPFGIKVWSETANIWAPYSMSTMWRGYPFAVARAFLVNGVGFMIYDALK